jgi:hypothetical protein
MYAALTPFERGVVAHLVADWLFQNHWIAQNKSSLRHPAAWVHGLIHILLLALALGWLGGLILGVIHMLIDTRAPMSWWRGFIRQTSEGPAAMTTAIWADQVLHIALIALWVGLMGPPI